MRRYPKGNGWRQARGGATFHGFGGLAILAWVCLHASFGRAAESTAEARPQVTRDLTYVRRGEQELKADVYVPEGPGPFAGVLMVHGGAWMSGNKAHMGRHAQVLVRHNYTVVSIAYRLAPKNKFPDQLEDCRDAVRWMRRHGTDYKIDRDRIGAYGYSAGGHLVSLLAVTEDGSETGADDEKISTRVQCVIAGGAPCDFEWLPQDSNVLAYFLGGSRQARPEVYRDASPTTFASPDDPPTFFFHGEQDTLVPRSAATALMKRLQGAGVRTEMFVVPKAGHIQTFFHAEPPKRAVAFLDSVLKPEATDRTEPDHDEPGQPPAESQP